MANRTVQIKGYGFGPTPAVVTATVNGTQVFSGAVDTINEPVPPMPAAPNIINAGTTLFTFEIPMEFQGTLPMTCEVSESTVVFAQILANYANVANVANVGGNTVVTFTSSGANGYVNIYNPWPVANVDPVVDARSNVVKNGEPKTITPEDRASKGTAFLSGTYWWTINAGGNLVCDVNVTAGLE